VYQSMDKVFSDLQKQPKSSESPIETPQGPKAPTKKALPKGVVLDKDGKLCRSCTSFAAWAQMTKKDTLRPTIDGATTAETASTALPAHCPPDVETLGRSTWTFLHTLSASYPPRASLSQQSEMTQFLQLFSRLYPCWHCAEDFREWMARNGNEPRVEGREGLGRWMCEAHNEVNRKLGKREFDCGKWRERWAEGPGDGSCG
ncbi:MAG: hypothetical protein Q9217_006352, partial [Psora testacea]